MYHPQYKTLCSRPQLVQSSRLKMNGVIHVKAPGKEKRNTSERRKLTKESKDSGDTLWVICFYKDTVQTQCLSFLTKQSTHIGASYK